MSVAKKFISIVICLSLLVTFFAVNVSAEKAEVIIDGEITNITMHVGATTAERNITWFSTSDAQGKLLYAKASELIDGKIPETDGHVVSAIRDTDGKYISFDFEGMKDGMSLRPGYYNNKAVMTNLEPDTKYFYQVMNGTDKSQMIEFTTGSVATSFNFAFVGDPQIGRGASDGSAYEADGIAWGRTLNQIATDDTFENTEFILSAGDQVNGGAYSTTFDLFANQWNAFIEHDELKSIPIATTVGNHDVNVNGTYYQHYHMPNMDRNYGATSTCGNFDGADYYFVYNSVLFVVLNTNGMNDKDGSDKNRAEDLAVAQNHGAFINKVLDETKDNKDILWKVLVYHQSPYGSSYHNNTNMTNGVYDRNEQYAYINYREYLIPYIENAGFNVVLSGHDHCYTRTHMIKSTANGESQIIDEAKYTGIGEGTGSGNGAKTAPTGVVDPDPGYMVHMTGATSTGSQVNGVASTIMDDYTAVNASASHRHATRFEVTPNSMSMVVYNLGTKTSDSITEVDRFTITRTADVEVESVSLDESVTIPVGQTKALNAKLSPVEPSNPALSWTSDNEAVATVEGGVVTAKTAGNANITVTTANGKTATCAVKVIDEVQVDGISLSVTDLEVYVGATKTVYAEITPETATTKDVIWTSEDENIAVVSENGSITGVAQGSTRVVATTKASGKTAVCNVTVKATPADSVELSKSLITMKPLEEVTITAKILPENATNKTVEWSSSDEAVATVENGKIKTLKQGTVTITAKNAEGVSGSCVVTVVGGVLFCQDYENPSFTPFSSKSYGWRWTQLADGNWVNELIIDETTKFASDYYPADSLNANGTAPLPAGEFAICFDICNMSADGAGILQIHGYDNSRTGNYYSFDARDLEIGQWYNVKITQLGTGVLNAKGYVKKVTDSTYKTFDSKEYDHAISSGQNRLALYLDNDTRFRSTDIETEETIRKTHLMIDNVKVASPVAVTAVGLDKKNTVMEEGETIKLTTSFAPENATDTHVGYSTSNSSVATVDVSGNVKAVGDGEAVITVTSADGGHSASCTVKVGLAEKFEDGIIIAQDYEDASNKALTAAHGTAYGSFTKATDEMGNTYGVMKGETTSGSNAGRFRGFLLNKGGGLEINDWSMEVDLRCEVPGSAVGFEYYDKALDTSAGVDQRPYKNTLFIRSDSVELGKWYRYRITCDKDATDPNVHSFIAYRKDLSNPNAQWEEASIVCGTANACISAAAGGFMIRFNHSNLYVQANADKSKTEWWIDNIKLCKDEKMSVKYIMSEESIFTAKASFSDAAEWADAEKMTLVVASYNSGRLIDVMMKETDVVAGEALGGFEINAKGANEVKVFVWDGTMLVPYATERTVLNEGTE